MAIKKKQEESIPKIMSDFFEKIMEWEAGSDKDPSISDKYFYPWEAYGHECYLNKCYLSKHINS